MTDVSTLYEKIEAIGDARCHLASLMRCLDDVGLNPGDSLSQLDDFLFIELHEARKHALLEESEATS